MVLASAPVTVTPEFRFDTLDPALRPARFEFHEKELRTWPHDCIQTDLVQGSGWVPNSVRYDHVPKPLATATYRARVPRGFMRKL